MKTENENSLYDQLTVLSESDNYPFHMPGHKRQSIADMSPYSIDITEIGGFDNLQHPRGLIKNIEERLRSLYSCNKAYILVNGSTVGNLSLVYAALKPGEHILIARNCHKSVYHGAELRSLRTDYVSPKVDEYGIQQGIEPADVEEAIEKYGDIKAFIMTSPTYEGIVSDIKIISEICHDHNVTLIVDSAHGAHMGVIPGFGKNAVSLGADAVVVSLHKTLPMYTMSAAILTSDNCRIDETKLETGIRIFQTTSPSYIIMSGIDVGVRYIEKNAKKKSELLLSRLSEINEYADKLNNLEVYKNKAKEPSKIVLISRIKQYTGPDLMNELRDVYHLELEMAVGQYAIAMTSIMDTADGFTRLKNALFDIDKKLSNEKNAVIRFEKLTGNVSQPYKEYEIYEAVEMEKVIVDLKDAKDKIAGEEVCVYPPGIPTLQPGEIITNEIIMYLKKCQGQGLEVEGVSEDGKLRILAK